MRDKDEINCCLGKPAGPEPEQRYFVEAAAKALDILESFNGPEEELRIAEIVRRAGASYCSTFRLLYTLEKRGYVMRAPGSKKYKLVPAGRRLRIGYAALDQRCPYSQEISRSLALAARAAGVDLRMRDAESGAANAIANVVSLLEEHVHLLIVRQPHDEAAAVIAARCHETSVPLLAVDYPHRGAHYFGINYRQAGRLCGEYLRARPGPGPLLVLTPTPMNDAHRSFVRGLAGAAPWPADHRMTVVGGSMSDAYHWVKGTLKDVGAKAGNLRIAALSDTLTMAGLRALAHLGAEIGNVLVGVGGSQAVVTQVRRDGPAAALAACFPETYGNRLLSIAMRILRGEPVASCCYSETTLIDGANVDAFYPGGRVTEPQDILQIRPIQRREARTPVRLPGKPSAMIEDLA